MNNQKLKCCDECPGDDTCKENKYCMCGCEMEAHDIGSGHSPVSMHDYYSQSEQHRDQVIEDSLDEKRARP